MVTDLRLAGLLTNISYTYTVFQSTSVAAIVSLKSRSMDTEWMYYSLCVVMTIQVVIIYIFSKAIYRFALG